MHYYLNKSESKVTIISDCFFYTICINLKLLYPFSSLFFFFHLIGKSKITHYKKEAKVHDLLKINKLISMLIRRPPRTSTVEADRTTLKPNQGIIMTYHFTCIPSKSIAPFFPSHVSVYYL